MINLSQKEIDEAKAFLKALFSRGGLNVPYANSRFPYGDATAIVKEIVNRQFTFITNQLDASLQLIAIRKFQGPGGGLISRPAETLAKYIAWFCRENNIIWNDSLVTPYELDAYKQTILGKALYDNGCFASFDGAVKSQVQQTSSQPQQSTKTPGQPPVISYKASGPHSQDIPNLVGVPNNKFSLTSVLYSIEADKLGQNTPRIFITPLKVNSSGIIKVSQVQAEKINFGSGNFYTDCQLFFDDQNTAVKALVECNGQFGNKFNNIHIVQVKKNDPNGYFEVSTDVGNAYIKAKVLNEDLDKLIEKLTNYENTSKNFKIEDVELYDEWMHKSIS